MSSNTSFKTRLPDLTNQIVETYQQIGSINHLGHTALPSREAIVQILFDLTEVLYPGYRRRQNLHLGNVVYHTGDLIDGIYDSLSEQIARARARIPRQPTRRCGRFRDRLSDTRSGPSVQLSRIAARDAPNTGRRCSSRFRR